MCDMALTTIDEKVDKEGLWVGAYGAKLDNLNGRSYRWPNLLFFFFSGKLCMRVCCSLDETKPVRVIVRWEWLLDRHDAESVSQTDPKIDCKLINSTKMTKFLIKIVFLSHIIGFPAIITYDRFKSWRWQMLKLRVYILMTVGREVCKTYSNPSCSQVSHSSLAIRKLINSLVQCSNSSSLMFERLMRWSRHEDFIICKISNIFALRRERWSVAVSLALENILTQGTEEAWLGKTSKAICTSVGYDFPFSYFILKVST